MNIKKIGLTALAASLVSVSAHAGSMSVSGGASMNVTGHTGEGRNAGTSFTMGNQLTFSGSGELDNGMTASYYQALFDGTLTSSNVKLDMGDMGTLGMGDHNHAGIGTISDIVPNGGEQPWDDLGTATQHGKPEQGVASPHAGDRLGYKTTAGGAIISASINYEQSEPTTSVAVQLPGLVEGLNIGAGMATDQSSATTEQDIETVYATYTMGGISVGYQTTEVDVTAANSDIERTAYGISFAVNDNLSVGYGVSDTEFDALTPDEENVGIGIAYTSGGMKLGIINNTKDNPEGVTGAEEMTEFQLTFAF